MASECTRTCQLCLKQPAKYTCPRCNAGYCSSACYKCESHAQCSEAFYKDCFLQGLKEYKSNSEDRQKVLQMLSRLNEQENELDSDDDEPPDLHERLEGLNLDEDEDKIWHQLTDAEKAEFHKMVDDGSLGSLVDIWQPWWNDKPEKVQDMECEGVRKTRVPEIVRDIANLSQLFQKNQPAASVMYNVLNTLYGYAYITRLYNGDHMERPLQCSRELLQLSSSLQSGNFSSVSEALNSCMHFAQSQASSIHVSREFSAALLQDVQTILQGVSKSLPLQFVLAALSDLYRLFLRAADQLRKEAKKSCKTSKEGSQKKAERQKLFSVEKKIEYYINWVQKYGLCLQTLVVEVELEFCSLTTEISMVKQTSSAFENKWGGKRPPKMHKFIEEIT